MSTKGGEVYDVSEEPVWRAQVAELNARRDLWKALAAAVSALVALAQQAAKKPGD